MRFHFSCLLYVDSKAAHYDLTLIYSLHPCCLLLSPFSATVCISHRQAVNTHSSDPPHLLIPQTLRGSNQKADNSQQHAAPASESLLCPARGGKTPQDQFLDARLNYCLTCCALKFLMTTTYCTGSASKAKPISFVFD